MCLHVTSPSGFVAFVKGPSLGPKAFLLNPDAPWDWNT